MTKSACLLRQCTARAVSIPDLTGTQRLSAISFDYNSAVLNNVENVDNGAVRTFKLGGAVTTTLLKKYWAQISKQATVL